MKNTINKSEIEKNWTKRQIFSKFRKLYWSDKPDKVELKNLANQICRKYGGNVRGTINDIRTKNYCFMDWMYSL